MFRRKNNKFFLLIIALLMGVLLFSGCIGKDNEDTCRRIVDAVNKEDLTSALAMVSPEFSGVIIYRDDMTKPMEGKAAIEGSLKKIIDNKANIEVLELNYGSEESQNSFIAKINIKCEGSDIPELKEGIRADIEGVLDAERLISQSELTWNQDDLSFLNNKQDGFIGIIFEYLGQELFIRVCANNSPAKMGGVKAGDIIWAVDGIPVSKMLFGMDEVAYRIRGEIDTKVTLTLKRQEEYLDLQLIRAKSVY